ncbi:MAG: Nramp family divalent metal transporter [Candidatus Geothermincolia bacterium]
MNGKTRRNFLLFLTVLGPGLITAMVDNDAGGIATYSIAGARYGYGILWMLVFTAIALAVVQEMTVRMGMVTGKGLAALIRERFSLRLTALLMLALLITNFANTMSNFAGIAASLELFGITRYIAVPILAGGIWWLVVKGTYKWVEKIFLMASLVYISYILSALMARPAWGDVAKGVAVPHMTLDSSFIVIMVTIVGTTIAPWMQFYQQAAVVDKGLDLSSYRYERWDTILGAALMTVVAGFIIIATAAAFFNNPSVGATSINTADEAARALAPIAGRNASYLFGIGLFVASSFAGSILPLSTAYTVCDAFGWESGIDHNFHEAPRFYILYTSFIVGGGVLMLIPKIPLLSVMFISQTMNGILLPVILVCMLLICNDREIMGDYVNKGFFNGVAWAVAIGVAALSLILVVVGF